MWPRFIALLFACSLLTVTACAKNPALAPESVAPSQRTSAQSAAPVHRASSAAGSEIHGSIGPAEYALFTPDEWNGDLVLYTHGYIPTSVPVGIAATEGLGEHLVAMRNLLLERGFAVGYSSFSENGFAVKEGARATNQLREVFASKFGAPDRTFLIGQSLGSLAALVLVERHPDLYAGALSAAGILGGSRAAIDYYAHIRVLFDCFYPGTLPGSLLELPDGLDVNRDIVGPAVTAMSGSADGAFAISQIAQTPVPFRSGEELVKSIALALGFHAIALQDLLRRTHGHSLFDNSETVYSSASLPAEVLAHVNGCVARYSISSDARAYFQHNYEPTGRLSVPVLTLHMQWDPIAPHFHEAAYRGRVSRAGALDLLEQRTIEKYGHPSIPAVGDEILAPEIVSAFEDLVARAAPGARAADAVASRAP